MTQEIVRELVGGVWVTRPKDQTGGVGSQTVKSYRALITNADLVEGQDHVDLPFTIPADEVIVYTSTVLLETFDDGGMFDPAYIAVQPSGSAVVSKEVNLLDPPTVAEGITYGKDATGNGTGFIGDDTLMRPTPVVADSDPTLLALYIGNADGDGSAGQALVIVVTVPKTATV